MKEKRLQPKPSGDSKDNKKLLQKTAEAMMENLRRKSKED
jgi:hypothetical protein